MYCPSHFALSDIGALHEYIQRNVFATFVGVMDGVIHFAYVPVVLDAEPQPLGSVRFHFARANPLAGIEEGAPLKLSFMGAHAYVSPDWYETPGQVPTWNYTAVEATGRVRCLTNGETICHFESLAAQEEAILAPKRPWTVAKVDTDRLDKLLSGIVGFHLVFDALEGKAKLSQNRNASDVAGVITGLEGRDDEMSRAIAQEMRKRST